MKKARSIDIFRACACLTVLWYHVWVLCGNNTVNIPVLRQYLYKGGEIGVTAFFALSGFGIYFSLYRAEQTGGISFKAYIKKRLHRIVPQYYFNLFVALLFTSAGMYVAKEHILNVFSHLVFLHGYSFKWHGAINGVLWTMSIMFQFYVVAILLYKIINRLKGIYGYILCVVFTIVAKYATLNYFWVEDEAMYGSFAYSIPGRQLWSSLDNFVVGMCVAYIVIHKKKELNSILRKVGSVVCVVLIAWLAKVGMTVGKGVWDCSWHSVLAALLGLLMLCVYDMQPKENGIFSRMFLWVSKYEYGIYLWHLIIIKNLLEKSAMIQGWVSVGKYGRLYLTFTVFSIAAGYIMTECVEAFCEKISRKKE